MLAARRVVPSPGQVAQQGLRSAVNFGVVSVARVLGASPAERLELRCECGTAGCAAVVAISLREYQEAQLDGALLVVAAHAGPESIARNATERWAVVEREPGAQTLSEKAART